MSTDVGPVFPLAEWLLGLTEWCNFTGACRKNETTMLHGGLCQEVGTEDRRSWLRYGWITEQIWEVGHLLSCACGQDLFLSAFSECVLWQAG